MNAQIALCALLLSCSASAAVFVDPGQRGQVLLFPYYTVNGGNDTLWSINNHGPDAKALKVRFREGRNGRVVDSFNLYLAPFDTWTGAVFSLGENVAASILTGDNSCTVPGLAQGSVSDLPLLPSGRPYRPFSATDYTGPRDDAGEDGAQRSREGWFEVIEMGTLRDDSPAYRATLSTRSFAPDCAWFRQAWVQGGVFDTAPEHQLDPPSGDLSGRMFVIAVSEGTAFSLRATALGGFSEVVQHSAPSAATPDLSSARGSNGVAETIGSIVWTEHGPVRSSWPAERALDAVSAVLMQSTLGAEVNIEQGLGARTEWILTLPTRPGLTDQARVGSSARAPFSALYPGADQPEPTRLRCEVQVTTAYDREGRNFSYPPSGIEDLFPAPLTFCHSTQVLAFPSPANGSSPLLGSKLIVTGTATSHGFENGQVQLDLSDNPAQRLVSREGHVYAGLPIIAHAAERIENQNAKPRVIGFYADATAIPGRLRCTMVDTQGEPRNCARE